MVGNQGGIGVMETIPAELIRDLQNELDELRDQHKRLNQLRDRLGEENSTLQKENDQLNEEVEKLEDSADRVHEWRESQRDVCKAVIEFLDYVSYRKPPLPGALQKMLDRIEVLRLVASKS
jgi:uncharacterized coiled-coil DUF342 family protein